MRTNLSDNFTPEQRKAWGAKIIARNTFRYTRDGETILRLHRTDIARKRKDGSVVLDSGGYKTVTTKDRMNILIPAGYSLYQCSGVWYVRQTGGDRKAMPYFDGIQIPQCFEDKTRHTASRGELVKKQELGLQAAIKKFACIVTDDNCPMPSGGDCLLCSMHTKEGKSMGELGSTESEREHLLSHMKEGYLHGSLIVNALTFRGYKFPGVILSMQYGRRDIVRRALRAYLKAKLGLVRS